MSEARGQKSGVKREMEQGAACEAGASAVCATGTCASGDCVRNALIRLVVVAAVLAAVAFATGQMAWLLLSGLLAFTAAVLWALDKLPARGQIGRQGMMKPEKGHGRNNE